MTRAADVKELDVTHLSLDVALNIQCFSTGAVTLTVKHWA
jgi:hypothetical protein